MDVWKRPRHVATPAAAEVFLTAFFPGDDPPALQPSASRHGIPPGPQPGMETTFHRRVDDPAWFEGFLGPELRAFAPGRDFAPVEASRSCLVARLHVDDPVDLSHLQWAWALSRALVDAGAVALLDLYAARWRFPDDVRDVPVDAELAIEREVTVVFETAATEGGYHVAHTRGMVKVARPDVLIVDLGPDDAEVAGDVLWAVAHGMALGRTVAPGEDIRIHGRVFHTRRYDPTVDPDVELQNEGLVLALHG